MTTIKEHCCGADIFFDKKMAEKQYRQYLKKGPAKVTTKLIQQLEKLDVVGKSLIDVGGGIGALQWWFLQNEGKQTTGIDASSAYLQQAEKYAAKKNWGLKANAILGDFAKIHSQLNQADYITLDKVICCYPDYEEIIKASCLKANLYVSLSYPMDGPIAVLISWIGVLLAKFKSKSFRPYIHPVNKIRAGFKKEGFERISHSLSFPWHVETYVREKE